MATRTVRTVLPAESVSVDDVLAGTREEAPQSFFDPGQVGDEEISADLALRAALASIGESENDAKVIVYQIDEKTKKDVYLYDCSVTEFAASGLQEIQARYGAGEYRIRVYSPRGGVLTHRRISIGAPKTPVSAPIAPNPANDIAALLAQQQAMFMAGMREMIAAIKPAQNAQPSVAETISLITALQGMNAPRRETDPLDMLSKIIAIQRDIAPPVNANGEIDSGAVILKAIDAFGKPLMEMAAKNAGTAPQVIQGAAVQNAPLVQNPALPAPTVQTPTQSEDEMKFAAMKFMIIHAAKSNADHYTYANNLLDFMGDETAAQFLGADNWREQLEALIPEAAQHRPWFEQVRKVALELLQPEEDDGTVTAIANPGTTTDKPA